MTSITEKLELHRLWLRTKGQRGDCAIFDNEDLRKQCFSRQDLTKAMFRSCNLIGASFYRCVLSKAIFSGCDASYANFDFSIMAGAYIAKNILEGASFDNTYLREASFESAILKDANLKDLDLCHVDLRNSVLTHATLRGSSLAGRNLVGANLFAADLSGSKADDLLCESLNILDRTGDITGWKKCSEGTIVKLTIPKGTPCSNATTRKCRAKSAIVSGISGGRTEATSIHDSTFAYRLGETVEPSNGWCDDRWIECAPGIHFYLSRAEALAH